jgi:hypothetical protein
MTMRPPTKYNPTLAGERRSATRPIDFRPPMMTSHVRIAMMRPESQVGIANSDAHTTAIELGCVKGVVVRAATPATSA